MSISTSGRWTQKTHREVSGLNGGFYHRNQRNQMYMMEGEKIARAKEIFDDMERLVKEGRATPTELYTYNQVMEVSEKLRCEQWRFNIAWLEILSMGSPRHPEIY